MTDTDLERSLTGMLAEASQHPVDAGRGWRDFQLLRSRSRRNRRRAAMMAAVAAVVVLLTGIRVVAGGAPVSRSVTGPPPTSGSTARAGGVHVLSAGRA